MVIMETQNRRPNNIQKPSAQSYKTQIKILLFPGWAQSLPLPPPARGSAVFAPAAPCPRERSLCPCRSLPEGAQSLPLPLPARGSRVFALSSFYLLNSRKVVQNPSKVMFSDLRFLRVYSVVRNYALCTTRSHRYKIRHAVEEVAQWDYQSNAPDFILEVPLRNLLPSMCDF